MAGENFPYVIIGGGVAGAAAIDGIREQDKEGAILLVCGERHLPYNRPPLSKKLWTGRKGVEEIFVHGGDYYKQNGVTVLTAAVADAIDPIARTVTLADSRLIRYERLLLATGATPKKLPLPGADLPGIVYYRTIDDYQAVRDKAAKGAAALVVGGGFIGSEMAAALSLNGLEVTMLFPESYLCERIFPLSPGKTIHRHYEERGIKILTKDKPVSFSRSPQGFLTTTEQGRQITSDLLIIGTGVKPAVDLAEGAHLATGDGIVVNDFLHTSDPDIFAAGDVARFPCQPLGRSMRFEHWDNGVSQGKYAGRNMAGARERYDYLPYFFSDLFDFGYEAVGEIDSSMETFADWQEEHVKGVIYYLKDERVRGVMLCNVWEKVDEARALIKDGKRVSHANLVAAIR